MHTSPAHFADLWEQARDRFAWHALTLRAALRGEHRAIIALDDEGREFFAAAHIVTVGNTWETLVAYYENGAFEAHNRHLLAQVRAFEAM